MPTCDPRIDSYIDAAAPFARPILREFRRIVHEACPQVEETMKWSMPHFTCGGELLCGMAAFKAHCAISFWKAQHIADPHGVLTPVGKSSMGQLGRIAAVADLPSEDVLKDLLRAGAALNAGGAKPRKKVAPKPKPAATVPEALQAALDRNPAARTTFDSLAPGYRREFTEWIAEAKREETRARRVDQAIALLADGKTRYDKYKNC